jgi:hypothetical protein
MLLLISISISIQFMFRYWVEKKSIYILFLCCFVRVNGLRIRDGTTLKGASLRICETEI